jgi:hypothetical protein
VQSNSRLRALSCAPTKQKQLIINSYWKLTIKNESTTAGTYMKSINCPKICKPELAALDDLAFYSFT